MRLQTGGLVSEAAHIFAPVNVENIPGLPSAHSKKLSLVLVSACQWRTRNGTLTLNSKPSRPLSSEQFHLLSPGSIVLKDGVPAHIQGVAVQASEADTPSGGRISSAEGNWRCHSLSGPEHSLTEPSEGQIAQGSMSVLQLLLFTNSTETTSLSISSFHKDFYLPWGKKKVN